MAERDAEVQAGEQVVPALSMHDRAVTSLVGSLAHDLGSPLAALSANVAMAREACAENERGDGAVSEMLEDIASAVERLTAVLDDMRGYAVTAEPTLHLLAPIVERACRIARSASARRASITCQVAPDVQVHASASVVTRLVAQSLVVLTQDLPAERGDRQLVIRGGGSTTAPLVLELGPRGPLPPEAAAALRGSAAVGGTDAAITHDGRSVVVSFFLRGAP
ncbi:MAG: histidine kinase dimerization/phospho-acceptor domain-containing protein [Sandaracinus sp.]